MARSIDSDLRLGQIAVRMGVVPANELPALLREARAGHAEESQGGAGALGQVLLRKRLVSVSDYLYMARAAREEQEAEARAGKAVSADPRPDLHALESALLRLESGEMDSVSFEKLLVSSGEPLRRDAGAPTRFGRYDLLGEVARGGMGIVYRARRSDAPTAPIVALKVMIEADDDEVRLARFQREAELAAALDHPNIVRIHDAGQVDGMPFFTMDLVDGPSLEGCLETKDVPRDELVRALAQVGRGVHHAHERGIVHRDLKPGNVLLDQGSGQARITDFGLARDLGRMTRLTQVGQAVGTPYYMAPEQVRGERDVDGRADVYAIGVMLYEVLTGDIPFDADSPLSLFKKIDAQPVVLEVDEAKGIDARIHAITMRALAKERADRYATGEELARDLERYLEGKAPKLGVPEGPIEALRSRVGDRKVAGLAISLIALAVVVVAVAAVVGVRKMRDRRDREAARDEVQGAVRAASEARDQARVLLEGQDALGAATTAAAGRGHLDALDVPDAPVEEPPPRVEAAQQAWSALRGEAVLRELRELEARALVRASLERPDLRPRAREAVAAARAALPDEAALCALAADVEEADGDAAAALTLVDQALATAPEAGLLVRRGRLCLALGRAADAAASLSDALMRRAGDVEALVLRARAYLALGRLDAARADARNASIRAPRSVDAMLALGDVARARGRGAEARDAYVEASKAAGGKDARPELRLGELRLADGAFEDAAAAFDAAGAREGDVAASAGGSGAQPPSTGGLGGTRPPSIDALLGRARARAGLLELAQARQALDAATAALPALPPAARRLASARALTLRGVLALAAGEVEPGREHLARAVEEDPRATGARAWLARSLLDQSSPGAPAIAAAAAALPAAGGLDDPDALEARALVALARGEVEPARELAERALASAGPSGHARARRTLARARLAACRARAAANAPGGEPGLPPIDDAARAACAAAWDAAVRGEGLGAAWTRRGLELVGLCRVGRDPALSDLAGRLLDAALRLDPHDARALHGRGLLHAQRGELLQALDALERAAALDPGRAEVADARARVALDLARAAGLDAGRSSEGGDATGGPRIAPDVAKAALARALAGMDGLDSPPGGPSGAARMLLVARCRQARGELDLALEALEAAQRLAPGRPDLLEAQARALRAAGREADAPAVEARAAEARARHDELLARAQSLAQDDPAGARRALREALLAARADPSEDPRARDAALRLAELDATPEARDDALGSLAPTLLGAWTGPLERSLSLLAPCWDEPLPLDRRRALELRASDGATGAAIAIAMAAVHDELLGGAERAWLEAALGRADEVVERWPGSIAAQAVRGYLRVHTGDVARGRRELEAIAAAVPGSAFARFALAEAFAATGEAGKMRVVLEDSRSMPRHAERVAASPFLR